MLVQKKARATGQLPHLDPHARNRLRPAPAGQQVDRALHVTLGRPVGRKRRRLVRDADVFGQDGQDRLVELPVDEGLMS